MKKLILIFCFACLVLFARQPVFAQDEFEVTPGEITLNKENNFSATVTVKGIGASYDSNNLTVKGCADICSETKGSDGKVTITLLSKFIESKNYSIEEISQSISFEYAVDNAPKKTSTVRVIIPPRMTPPEISVKVGNATPISIGAATDIELIDGDKVEVTAKFKMDGATTDTTDYSLKSASTSILATDGKSFTAKDIGETTVMVLAGEGEDTKIGEFKVKVKPFIKSIDTANGAKSVFMPANSQKPLMLLLKDAKNRITTDLSRVECTTSDTKLLEVKPTATAFALNSKKLEADRPETRLVTCSVKSADKRVSEAPDLAVNITIQPKRGYMTIEALNGTTLLPNGALSFLINVYDANGTPKSGAIEYTLEDEDSNKQWVSVSPQGSKVTVHWVDLPDRQKTESRPNAVNLDVKATIPEADDYPVEGKITVRMGGHVTRFSSLKVKLNVMDDRTVHDLYGKVLSNEYYALMVRFFNDLKSDDKNANIGQSILAYSSSVEIAVGLEKQYDGSSDSGIEIWNKQKAEVEKKNWADQNDDIISNALPAVKREYDGQLRRYNGLMREWSNKNLRAVDAEAKTRTDRSEDTMKAAKKLRADAEALYRKAMTLREQLRTHFQVNLPPLEAFTYGPDVAINDGKWYPTSRDDLINIAQQEAYLSDDDDDSSVSAKDNEPNCVDTITYRPYTFEMMVNTVDRREERTWRSRIFKILKGTAFGASTAIAVAIPGSSSDLPLGIEKFGNVLIPGIEELIPNLKEQHRQNIVSQAMKPIEEIPFGSDITRVIFIPKKSISGLIRAHKARISLVCPFYFKVKVAVITKGGDVTLGGQRTP
ncbi:MAG: hypothetical protein IPI64_10300 [Chloracidobacterium sp.]|nr:hypothetical protein [Chloracidobacterium sp.]